MTLLYRMAGTPAVSGGTGFLDVPQGAWYADAVRWAETAGIAQGVAPQRFAPSQGTSRQELAVFLYRYGQAKGEDVSRRASLSGYTDGAEVAPWALEAVQWAVAEGILQGTSQETLSPQDTADRAQMAVMVQRFLAWEP